MKTMFYNSYFITALLFGGKGKTKLL